MKALRLHGIGDLRCDEVPVPEPKGIELLIKVGACGLCGSDLPRIYEHGTSNGQYPLTIGHEFAGEVVAVGERANSGLLGKRGAVFPLIPCGRCDSCITGHYAMCEHYNYLGSRCNGGFAEYCIIPSEWQLIPSQRAPMEALAMTEPACVAQHAVRRAGITAGDFVVIFGAGPIGLIAARWAILFGAQVLMVDVAANKVNFSQSKGFYTINSNETDVIKTVRALNKGKLASAAIEGTGVGTALEACIQCVRAQGRIALLGNPIDETKMAVKTHSMILRKEITINGVWNSSRSPYPINEWEFTVAMLDEEKLDVTDLITDRLSLEDIPCATAEIMRGSRHIVKAMYV